jgi:MFS family permease
VGPGESLPPSHHKLGRSEPGINYWPLSRWQGLGLLATALYQEFGVEAGRQGVIFSAMSAGLTAGAFFWGLAVDVIGRKWAFNMTVLITCVFVSLEKSLSVLLLLGLYVGFVSLKTIGCHVWRR